MNEMNNIELENFDLYVDWLVGTLKTQDPSFTQVFKRGIQTLLSHECLKEVIFAALCHLADTDAQTFTWAVHYYDPQLHVDLRYEARTYAVHKLIHHGFVPGKDFSSLQFGGLLLQEAARDLLLQDAPAFYFLLLQEILYSAPHSSVKFS